MKVHFIKTSIPILPELYNLYSPRGAVCRPANKSCNGSTLPPVPCCIQPTCFCLMSWCFSFLATISSWERYCSVSPGLPDTSSPGIMAEPA